MENTSGRGPGAAAPAEIQRWNWGAFLLTWIWGIGNNTLIALLMFVPFVNLVLPFVLGAKGSAWAWRNKRWESIAAFRSSQRRWALWGLALLVVSILLATALVFALLASLKGSEPYRMSLQALNSDPAAIQILGQPVSGGIPSGQIQVSGAQGSADLSFSVEGPKGQGVLRVRARKVRGRWVLEETVLETVQGHQRIEPAR